MTIRQVNDYLYIVDTSTELSTGWTEGVYAYVNDIKTEYIYKNSTFTLIASGVEPYAISFGLGDGFLSSTYSVLDYLGGYTSSFVASSMSEDLTYILPSGYGVAGSVLTDLGGGELSWLQAGSGTVSGYVPYIGATQDLNLGSYGILLSSLTMATGATSGYILSCDGSGNAFWVSGGGSSSGTVLTFISPLNETGGIVTINLSAYATTDSLSAYTLTNSLTAYATTNSLSAYALTEILTSYVTTASISSYIPYTGALSGVDLNTQNLTAGIGYFNSLTVSSTGLVANLNVDLLDNYHYDSFVMSATMSAYATTGSLTAYATTASLSAYAETEALTSYVLTSTLSSYGLSSTIVDDYVPYSGAIKNVDLGGYSLVTTGYIQVGDNPSTGATEYVVNVLYGTSNPPVGTYKEGTVYFKY